MLSFWLPDDPRASLIGLSRGAISAWGKAFTKGFLEEVGLEQGPGAKRSRGMWKPESRVHWRTLPRKGAGVGARGTAALLPH